MPMDCATLNHHPRLPSRVGGSTYPSIERILPCRPELVLANAEENREPDVDALRAAGVPVWTTAAAGSVPQACAAAQRAQGPPQPAGRVGVPAARGERAILTVQALDAIDGTPVLDLKPYMTEFGPRGQVRQPA